MQHAVATHNIVVVIESDKIRGIEIVEEIEGLDPQAWDTIRKALDFERDQRLETVNTFLSGLFEEQG